VLARSRARACCACALVALTVAGCQQAATSSTVTVPGTTLTVYASMPARAAGARQSADVLAAEQLALREAGEHVGSFRLRLVELGGRQPSDNARTAIENPSSIAYLGELIPGSSSDSIAITNAEDLLQVSPTDTAVELTQATPAVGGAPTRYYESQALKSYGRTFARVVPTTALEAKALVAEMRALRVRTLYVADDGQAYGRAAALAVRSDAGTALHVVSGPVDVAKVKASGADGVFLATGSYVTAASMFNALAAAQPAIKLFGPSSLADDAFASSLSSAAQRAVRVSAPGFYNDLDPAGRKFAADFRAAYHHPPAVGAIFGYEAMSAVVASVRQAGAAANRRSEVVRQFFGTRNRQSVLGTYSMNVNGDTSVAPFVFSRAQAGRLVPYKSVQEHA